MKKLISLLLSLLLILNTFGFNLIVILLIHEAQTENLDLIDEHPGSIVTKNIVTFNPKSDNISFINSREIRYDGEMYDIICTRESNGDKILYCVNDKKDTRLHAAFRSLNDLGDNPASIPNHLALSILKNLLKQYLPGPDNNFNDNYNCIHLTLRETLSILSVIPEKNYPPPEILIISC